MGTTPMRVCKNCMYWKLDMKGLCGLTQEGVGLLWTCDKWKLTLSNGDLLSQYSAQAGKYYLDPKYLSETSLHFGSSVT